MPTAQKTEVTNYGAAAKSFEMTKKFQYVF
jgi:hypothetical protein